MKTLQYGEVTTFENLPFGSLYIADIFDGDPSAGQTYCIKCDDTIPGPLVMNPWVNNHVKDFTSPLLANQWGSHKTGTLYNISDFSFIEPDFFNSNACSFDAFRNKHRVPYGLIVYEGGSSYLYAKSSDKSYTAQRGGIYIDLSNGTIKQEGFTNPCTAWVFPKWKLIFQDEQGKKSSLVEFDAFNPPIIKKDTAAA